MDRNCIYSNPDIEHAQFLRVMLDRAVCYDNQYTLMQFRVQPKTFSTDIIYRRPSE